MCLGQVRVIVMIMNGVIIRVRIRVCSRGVRVAVTRTGTRGQEWQDRDKGKC